MRVTRILRVCGATILGVTALSRPALCQPRSAAIRVTAQVVDVGALRVMPVDSVEAMASTAAAVTAPSGRVFSVVPPRHSVIGVSLRVRGVPAGHRDAMAVQVCRPREGIGARCRRAPFADSLEGAQAAVVTNEAVLLRLPGVTDLGADTAQVTITLDYLAN